jgi:hypothetical protein
MDYLNFKEITPRSRGPPIFQKYRGHTKQVPYRARVVLEWPVKLTVICRFLLQACELMRIFVYQAK